MSQQFSKKEFKARVQEWAKKLDFEIKTISIREMKHKWESFTLKTKLLIFNKKLLDMDADLCDYVIVHELLHFHVPNHGKLWKTLMRAHLGDYEKAEEELKSKS